ncbi:hypothetical protein ONE63_000148 [Megalurothrips usitatus]|uniref:BLUF domain-containing protein n=1 Tax=Megalurothrips usitatus TaxID=439358 RepID=A0AAV7Y2G7_9NEOP|nr:hypothetical protein ONE63_000148 [Megalurothrips usitatus]
MLYIGEHRLGRGVEDFMKTVVSVQAEQPREEGLTGFLLVYQNHFIHIVEGSESTLSRHLRSVIKGGDEAAEGIGKVKVILEITHVNKRCFVSWSSRIATPPTLASQLKLGAAEAARHADAVLTKVLRLVDTLKKLPPGAPLSQHQALQLPEAELLQALLDSPLLQDARDLLQEQRQPPRIALYDDAVWPMQSDFVPYNLLEEPIAVPSEIQLDTLETAEGDDGDEEGGGGKGR